MADLIRLSGIRAFGFHGVYPDEQRDGQEFVVDITAHLDLTEAGQTDDLAATVHYGELAEAVAQRVAEERWDLIERVAQRVADLVLDRPAVQAVDVTVHKPQAPIAVPVGDVSVTITRSR